MNVLDRFDDADLIAELERRTRAVLRASEIDIGRFVLRPTPIAASSRAWCAQCERNVMCAEAEVCDSTFCKAKQPA